MNTCILCKSSKKDDVQYGDYLQNKRFGVHTFCLYLSSNLPQNGNDDQDFLGFLEADIKNEVDRISLLPCFYCKKKYANIGCCEKKCRRSFHLICGIEHNAQNRFCFDYRSYCHRHVRKIPERPSAYETCVICYENLRGVDEPFNSVNSILAPCCRNGWFHKFCIQKFAKTSGYFFKCPLCNDIETFREKLPAKGIYIPNQDAAWELEPNAYAELLERPNECCAQSCKNRKGRKASSANNTFVLCITCGSRAIHRQCFSNDVAQFHCTDCSVAFDENDSGRESLYSRINGGDSDDEPIDVCNVSDKEDFEIITKLIETNNRMTDRKRDSGSHTDEQDEEIHSSRRNCNKIRRIVSSSDDGTLSEEIPRSSRNCNKMRRIVSSSDDGTLSEEIPRSSRTCNKMRRIVSSSDDGTLSEEIPRSSRNCKKIRRIVSSSDDDTLSEEIPRSSRNCNKGRRMADTSDESNLNSDTETEDVIKSVENDKAMTTKQIDLQHKMSNNHLQNVDVKIFESDDDDDPLEYFFETMERNNNIGYMSLSTTRSNRVNNIQTLSSKEIEKNEGNICNNEVQKTEKDLRKRNSERKFINLKCPEKSLEVSKNSLDISCIAKRTRRQTIPSCSSSSSNNMKNEKIEEDVPLKTRRKSICAQTDSSRKLMHEMSHVFEDNKTDNFTKVLTNDDGYERKLCDVSCVANRTRKRKILRTQTNTLSRIDEDLDYSTLDRCYDRHISSPTAKELQTAPSGYTYSTPRFLNINSRRNYDSFLEKFP